MSKKLFSNPDYRNLIALSALIFVLAAGALTYFLVLPALDNIKTMKTRMDNQSLETEKQYLAGKSLKNMSEALKLVEPRLGELDRVFLKKDKALEFIDSLEKIASTSRVAETAALGGETELDQTHEQIQLVITTRGSFAGQMAFLSALETLPHYLDISNLEVSAVFSDLSHPGKGNSLIVMRISADTYWQN